MRRLTRSFYIGSTGIGKNHPISIQSMISIPTINIEAVIEQLFRLSSAGCDLVRLGVPDEASAKALKIIRDRSPLPLIADIHFAYKLALIALESGVDALRLNPGNIRNPEHVKAIVRAAKERSIPIRIGVNAGSLDPNKYPHPTPEAMVSSAWEHIKLLEDLDFQDIKVSFKSHHVPTMIEANRLFAAQCDYPIHLGVTEAGDGMQAVVKNAIGMGTLLQEGIGDTLRVSITGDVVPEVEAGRFILRSLGLRQEGVEIVSCPTCARVEYDVLEAVNLFKEKTSHIKSYIRVAIMGCVVNGPGEAKEADLGIAVGKNGAVLFRKGKVLGQFSKDEMLEALLQETLKINAERILEESN
ncbi:4-hydroxy-3-methylbut-2-en-1-yl diphosphate synthase [Brevinema andersonii]|uniref:4-hydroxy-3-methylbut-2-en-1-yl diphosphate synthase (flavodoxin) n=1 Tax=Brevinema andersonii TaxID=34097 RepID=A0A1I1DLL4_BREAD|nr:flavodoxin-dependent (E)-4-hydroxy-3-methylbut-2-enyl-diphosphate synthase [Brevinema andersonii]SFB75781.1 4-hydroxy-3-methylbut-2-en-1-yl diphosphate synthase [Brevinema andersonii]